MKALVTGANGTVGGVLVDELRRRNVHIVKWNRAAVAPNDSQAIANYIHDERPDVLYHLAVASTPTGMSDEGRVVNVEWPTILARVCREETVRLVFTSTVMVFTNDAKGPFTLDSRPDATEGYGGEKREAEERVRAENSDAVIARIGWQIGDAPGSNNMVDYLHKQQQEHGCVRASEKWLPACSFLQDTAMVLCEAAHYLPGLYQLDSNRSWSFARIAKALNKRHGEKWKIEATRDLVCDQRMIDRRVSMPSLEVRFGEAAMPGSVIESERNRGRSAPYT